MPKKKKKPQGMSFKERREIERSRKKKNLGDMELSPKIIDLFHSLPSPAQESECIRKIHEFFISDGTIDKMESPEESAIVMHAMYSQWHNEN